MKISEKFIRELTTRGYSCSPGINFGVDLLVYTDNIENVHSKYGIVFIDDSEIAVIDFSEIFEDESKKFENNSRENDVDHTAKTIKNSTENNISTKKTSHSSHPHTISHFFVDQDSSSTHLTYRCLIGILRTLSSAGKKLILIDRHGMAWEVDRL